MDTFNPIAINKKHYQKQPYYYRYIKLQRDVEARDEDVNKEMSELMKFIYNRSKENNEIIFATLSYARKGVYDGYIVIISKDKYIIHREEEIITGFIKSMFNYIDAQPIKPFSAEITIPIPLKRIFFRRQTSIIFMNQYFLESCIKYPSQRMIYNVYDTSLNNIIPLGRPINSDYTGLVGISANTLLQHTVVLGATGSGKSTTTATLINNMKSKGLLNEKYRVIIIDWHGEYKNLIKEYKPIIPSTHLNINPLSNTNKTVIDVIDVFEEVFELTEPQSYLLYKIIKGNKSINSIDALLESIEYLREDSNWMKEVKLALLRKLSILAREKNLFRRNTNISSIINYSGKPIIVDVSTIRSILVRKTYTLFLLKSILEQQVGSNIYNIIIVVEEAHNIFPRKDVSRFLSKFVAEVRKFSIGVIAVTQSPSNIFEGLMVNSATKIIHSIRSSQDIDVIKKITKIPYEYEKILPVLNPGEAILYTLDYKLPILISVEETT